MIMSMSSVGILVVETSLSPITLVLKCSWPNHPAMLSKGSAIVRYFGKIPVCKSSKQCMSHSQMLGKVEYSGGPIFKVVLEC